MDDQELGDRIRRAHAAEVPPFPEEEIWRRIEADPGSRVGPGRRPPRPGVRSLVRVAASIVLFGAGVWVGRQERVDPSRRLDPSTTPGQPSPEVGFAATEASAIESAGIDYIRTLNRFRTAGPPAGTEEWARSRAVAMATIYGVADEIVRIAPDDPVASAVYQIMASHRAASLRGGADVPSRALVF